MSDTISRQAAIDAAIEAADDWDGGCSKERERFIRDALEELPSAQPDIIRCPDCYYNDGTAYCELHYRDVKAKDFCSWAERRE